MRCKHGLKTEHCSICTPNKVTEYEQYNVNFETEDGEKIKMRRTRKKVKYKSDKDSIMEEMLKKTYWGYSE